MADKDTLAAYPQLTPRRIALLAFIALWLVFQVLFPLRHLLYPGSPSWTEEGHRFAWQMKLRDKKANPYFTVRVPEKRLSWRVWPEAFLLPHQTSMRTEPDMILQFAHYLEQFWRENYGFDDVEVRVRACASLNGRPAALLIDPDRDLTNVRRSLRPADWILPLNVPFERPNDRKRRNDLEC